MRHMLIISSSALTLLLVYILFSDIEIVSEHSARPIKDIVPQLIEGTPEQSENLSTGQDVQLLSTLKEAPQIEAPALMDSHDKLVNSAIRDELELIGEYRSNSGPSEKFQHRFHIHDREYFVSEISNILEQAVLDIYIDFVKWPDNLQEIKLKSVGRISRFSETMITASIPSQNIEYIKALPYVEHIFVQAPSDKITSEVLYSDLTSEHIEVSVGLNTDYFGTSNQKTLSWLKNDIPSIEILHGNSSSISGIIKLPSDKLIKLAKTDYVTSISAPIKPRGL